MTEERNQQSQEKRAPTKQWHAPKITRATISAAANIDGENADPDVPYPGSGS